MIIFFLIGIAIIASIVTSFQKIDTETCKTHKWYYDNLDIMKCAVCRKTPSQCVGRRDE